MISDAIASLLFMPVAEFTDIRTYLINTSMSISKGNIKDDISFDARLRASYRTKHAEWLDGLGFNVGLTLNFNDRRVGLYAARERVRDCFARVDRRMLGRNFNKKSAEERVEGVFFFEHVESNLHCHGLVRVAPEMLARFDRLFPADSDRGVWADVCPSGTYALRDIAPRAAAFYVTKEQNAWSDTDRTLWLSESFRA